MIYRAWIFLLVMVSYPAWAEHDVYPLLSESYHNDAKCEQVLDLAKAVYDSASPGMNRIPASLTKDFVLKVALSEGDYDLSGGDALISDPVVFQKIPKSSDASDRSIYWQKKAVHGWRYVLNEEYMGSRGDTYSLFVVKATIDPEFFIKIMNDDMDNNEESPDYKRIIPADDRVASLYPPLMIREKGTTNIIAVDPDTRSLSSIENAWSVFSIGAGGNQKHCRIEFYPPEDPYDSKGSTALLPMPVQTLANLLDTTVGDPENAGTLQTYGRVRAHMLGIWKNVATRPWAVLAHDPSNSRFTVDQGLKQWSRQAKSFDQVYKQIITQYPKAEQALALYYKQHFHKTDEEANTMAKKILDIAFRSRYVFSERKD
jgi:hypothetical protein